MIKVMFVCYGNICRSPTAEFVFRDIVKKNGMEKDFVISSSATSSEELGNPVYSPSREEMKRHGIDCSGKYAIKLKSSDYDNYDLFIGMDSMNIRNMTSILNGDPDGKIHKLMDYTSKGGDVSDPWYTRRFDIAYYDILNGCTALFEHLTKNGGK